MAYKIHLQNLRRFYHTDHDGGATCGAKVSDSKIMSHHELKRGKITCGKCLTIFAKAVESPDTENLP